MSDDRRFPARPLLGVGAILLTPNLQKVLLIQRGREPSQGLWTFPGGLVEGGEGIRQACRRELREETGIEAELEGLAVLAERLVRDAEGRVEYHYVIVDLWGLCPEQPVAASTDAAAARWVPVDGLGGLPTTQGIPAAVERALRLARGEPPGSLLDEGAG